MDGPEFDGETRVEGCLEGEFERLFMALPHFGIETHGRLSWYLIVDSDWTDANYNSHLQSCSLSDRPIPPDTYPPPHRSSPPNILLPRPDNNNTIIPTTRPDNEIYSPSFPLRPSHTLPTVFLSRPFHNNTSKSKFQTKSTQHRALRLFPQTDPSSKVSTGGDPGG